MRYVVMVWICAMAAGSACAGNVSSRQPDDAVKAAEGTRVAASALVKKADEALRRSLAWVPVPVDLAVLRTPDPAWVPAGVLSIDAQPDVIAGDRIASVMRVRVNLLVDGRTVRTLPLIFSVKAPGTGPVAMRTMRAGEVITEADVRPGEVDLAAFAGARPLAMADLVGQRMKRDVKVDQAIASRWVEALPQVMRGERVAVELAQAGISLQAPGVALSDARMGERTKVKLWRDETVEVTVVGEDLVRLGKRAHP
jgi:flagella basal body P-ring formation protein FlgA